MEALLGGGGDDGRAVTGVGGGGDGALTGCMGHNRLESLMQKEQSSTVLPYLQNVL